MNKMKQIFSKLKNRIKKTNKKQIVIITLIILIIIIISCVVALKMFNATPQTLEDHLKELGFKKNENDCYEKEMKDEVPFLEKVDVCFNECRYYAEESVHRMAINMKTLDIEYTDFSTLALTGNVKSLDSIICEPYPGSREREIVKGSDSYNTLCNSHKLRFRAMGNLFKNIVEDYSLKCSKDSNVSILNPPRIKTAQDEIVTIDELKKRDEEYEQAQNDSNS